MRVVIKCSGCQKELKIYCSEVTPLGDIIIEVKPCKNKDCYDCGDCEEVQRANKLEEQIQAFKKKLKAIAEQIK